MRRAVHPVIHDLFARHRRLRHILSIGPGVQQLAPISKSFSALDRRLVAAEIIVHLIFAMKSSGIALAGRLALRPKEAAVVLGIGERTLRQILPELPHFRVGGAVLILVDGLRDWLREQARTEGGRVDSAVNEIMESVAPREED